MGIHILPNVVSAGLEGDTLLAGIEAKRLSLSEPPGLLSVYALPNSFFLLISRLLWAIQSKSKFMYFSAERND